MKHTPHKPFLDQLIASVADAVTDAVKIGNTQEAIPDPLFGMPRETLEEELKNTQIRAEIVAYVNAQIAAANEFARDNDLTLPPLTPFFDSPMDDVATLIKRLEQAENEIAIAKKKEREEALEKEQEQEHPIDVSALFDVMLKPVLPTLQYAHEPTECIEEFAACKNPPAHSIADIGKALKSLGVVAQGGSMAVGKMLDVSALKLPKLPQMGMARVLAA